MGTGASKSKEKGSNERMQGRDRRILIKTLGGHTGGINCMDISAAHQLLLTGSDDRTARLWDLVTYDCKVVLEGHAGYVSCCKLWQGHFALTGSFDRTVRKWNTVSGNCILKLEQHSGIVNRMLVYGEFLFTTSYDSFVVCWNLRDGEVSRIFRGHTKSVLPLAYVESPEHNSNGTSDLDQNKDTIITGSMDKTARLWSITSGTSLKTFRGHKGAILCLAIDMENRMLFTGSTDNTIKKWNMSTGGLLKSFRGHEGSIISLQVHHRLLYSASLDATARCWVAEFGDTTRKYIGHDHMVSDMKYHHGIVFTGSGDNNVRAFDAKSGTLKRTFKGHKFVVNCLLPYNDTILSASYDGSVKVWNVSDLIRDKIGASTTTLGSSAPASRNRRSSSPRETDTVRAKHEQIVNGDLHQHDKKPVPFQAGKVPMSRERSSVSRSEPQRVRGPRRAGNAKVAPANRNGNNNLQEDGEDFLDFDYINDQLQDLLEGEDYWAEGSTQNSMTNLKGPKENGKIANPVNNVKVAPRSGTPKKTTQGNPYSGPATRVLTKRESSDLLKKRPRTDSNASARSREVANESDLALVDEEMHMVAMETSSNTSGYRTAENNSLTSSPLGTTSKGRTDSAAGGNRSSKKSSVSFSPTVSMTSSRGRESTSQRGARRPQTVETSDIRSKAKLKHQDSTVSNGSVPRALSAKERKQLEQEILDMV